MSCPSTESWMNMASRRSFDSLNQDGGQYSEVQSDNNSLAENSSVTFDQEMYWEMNYHEASIYLEVNCCSLILV